jgi:hypothetical protein
MQTEAVSELVMPVTLSIAIYDGDVKVSRSFFTGNFDIPIINGNRQGYWHDQFTDSFSLHQISIMPQEIVVPVLTVKQLRGEKAGQRTKRKVEVISTKSTPAMHET